MPFKKYEVKDPVCGPNNEFAPFEGEYCGMDVYMGAEGYAMEMDGMLDFSKGRVIEIREIGSEKSYKIKVTSSTRTIYESQDAKEGE